MSVRVMLSSVVWCAAASIAMATAACISAELEGRACPCLDDYQCVDGVCVERKTLTSLCPERFETADACSDDPPARATLVAVCDDGNSFPLPLVQELGPAAGTCLGSDDETATMVAATVTGGFVFEEDEELGDATLDLTLSGSSTWRVTIPADCLPVQGTCLPSTGSGTCAADDDGCTCEDVRIGEMGGAFQAFAGDYFTGERSLFGCAANAGSSTYFLREDFSIGLGPIFVFVADEDNP